MLEIPINSDAPYFSQEHEIFGKRYLIEFEWIERENYWVLHIYDGHEQPIALGVRVLPGWPIFLEQEAGIAFIVVTKNSNEELNLKTLHKDFMLVAYEAL